MGISTLISTTTASGASNTSFTNITSTYDEYMWVLTDINPGTNATALWFQFSDDTSSHSYDMSLMTSYFGAVHTEDDTSQAEMGYSTGFDLALATGYMRLAHDDIGNGADECASAIVHLFNPADTTRHKPFMVTCANLHHSDMAEHNYVGGYVATTAAVTAIDFKPDQGVFDAVIQMYGIS